MNPSTRRVAVIGGNRIPFARSNTVYAEASNQDMLTAAIDGLVTAVVGPWLVETFVDTTAVAGTCFQAANWTHIGTTQGRGRQDRARAQAETVKDIYVYPLVSDFRARMGRSPARGRVGQLSGVWVGQERDRDAQPLTQLTAQICGDTPLRVSRPRAAPVMLPVSNAAFPKAIAATMPWWCSVASMWRVPNRMAKTVSTSAANSAVSARIGALSMPAFCAR
jgi:hypothetical protein